MELVSGFGGALWTTVSYGVPFLIVLTIVVFIHELGHFMVARWCGVGVSAFSIGFGHELYGWNDRHGTRWRIAAIPLGGYVKFEGDENAASMPDRSAAPVSAGPSTSYHAQSVWKRIAIVAAGPLANFILAIAIFGGIYASEGRQIILPYVGEVVEGGAASRAGIKPGDRIEAIDGAAVANFNDIIRLVSGSAGNELTVTVERGGERLDLVMVPKADAQQTSLGVQRRGMLGIRASQDPAHRVHQTFTPLAAVREASVQCVYIVQQTLNFFGRLLTGREHVDQISGIGRIAQLSGEAAKLGVLTLLNTIAFMSVSIGLLNLMPIPVLDGGHLVFYTLEALRGRPLSERAQDVGFRVGLAIVLGLMIVALWNDVLHFASRLGFT